MEPSRSVSKIMVVMVVFVAVLRSQTLPEQETRFGEVRRRELNGLVANYLTAFEELRNEPRFKDHADTMNTVQDLIIQAWIYMLRPDNSLLQKFVTVGDKESLTNVKERIISKLREKDRQSSVSDSILKFEKTIKPKIQEKYAIRIESVQKNIDYLSDKEEKEKDEKKKIDLRSILDEKLEELEDATFLFEFGNIATKMALQSYVLNFANTFEVISTDEKEGMEFDMPPLYPDSFEQLLDEDEDDDDLQETEKDTKARIIKA